jgi:hypothetical protein
VIFGPLINVLGHAKAHCSYRNARELGMIFNNGPRRDQFQINDAMGSIFPIIILWETLQPSFSCAGKAKKILGKVIFLISILLTTLLQSQFAKQLMMYVKKLTSFFCHLEGGGAGAGGGGVGLGY